jgi:hypothetical protein
VMSGALKMPGGVPSHFTHQPQEIHSELPGAT